MFNLKSKTARWCTVVCLVGGLVTSSSAVASQVKKPVIHVASKQQELKSAYNRTDEVLKKLESKPPRFSESDLQENIQPAQDAADIPANEPAEVPTKTVYLTFDDGPH